MKKNKRIKIIITSIIILILIIFFLMKITNLNYLENILIFNPYNNSTNNQYIIKLNSDINQFENAKLFIDSQTNEKLAPGMSGKFEIIIKSSKDINYKIKFESKNSKPKNLLFNIEDDTKIFDKLEDLDAFLEGEIYKNKEKRVVIEWAWKYENSINANQQDTWDGINLKNYSFDIYVLGS